MRFLLTLSLLAMTTIVCAQEKKTPAQKIVTDDPTKAGPDFAIQGEYEGPTWLDKKQKIGAQVIARGDGNFALRLLEGGFPGAGWNGKTQLQGTAKMVDGKVIVTGKEFSGTIADGKLNLSAGKDDKAKVESALSRVERKSPTLGEKPPSGAIVLFEKPEDVEKWKDAKIAELPDGKFLACPGKNIYSKDAFKNFKLHLEFRLAWMPSATGQGRSNSGVYLQNRYELQVLDSFGLKGENNECGGFYQQYAPTVNMCLPPLTWQTYDIDFTAAEFDKDGKRTKPARTSVKHNGVLVQDNVALKGPTGGGQKEEDKPGPLQLQWHGDPVVFRNVWVVEVK